MTVPLKKIDDYRWEIPVSYKEGMKVPGIIYTNETLLKAIQADQSIEQVANGAFLPGIVKASFAMPDMHFGYGLAIGGVVATDIKDGVVSPGGTGYDINCGVRLVRSNLYLKDIKDKAKELVNALYAEIPTGVGSKGRITLSPQEGRDLLVKGARWAVERGNGTKEDLEHTEAGGCLEGADPDKVSSRAFERGKRQEGTLGSGNHFLEIQYVDEIYDEKAANIMGIEKDSITVMIHSGSRGFGHQVCTDYLEVMETAVDKYNIKLPDRQLACAPINSPEGQDYLSAMRAAANYAWANRQFLMAWTREVFLKTLLISPKNLGMDLIYDVAHNIVKIEDHIVDGKKRRVAVHRKGATRAFPPGHPETPPAYKEIGQPVIIPGDMGRASYILVGTQRAMDETFGSTCHGAGRCLSRHAAIKATKGRAIHRELEDKGIYCRAAGRETLREEFPEAYKDVNEVVNVVHNAGISKKVARLKPLGVIKG
ncbi:MAG: RtcB family protein [Nitrospinae bacterium]|nr:RtcB family protein [Nitrospinota bacterium]